MTSRPMLIVTVLGLAGLLASCGSGDKPSVSRLATPKPAAQSQRARTALQDSRSAASVVAKYWDLEQIGALIPSLSLYDKGVISETGLAIMGGALAAESVLVKGLRLNILDQRPMAGGRLVMVEGVPDIGETSPHAFFLVRHGKSWRIVYDTLTDRNVTAYAAKYVATASAQKGDGTAAAAGSSAAARYRAAAAKAAGVG